MLKLALISDTHGQHSKINLESGDILIHAGDVSSRGGRKEIKDFLDWFADQPYRLKVFIAGNHDFWFEGATEAAQIELLEPYYEDHSVFYLQNTGVQLDDYNIWGSPWTPAFYDWAFMYKRGEGHKHWDLIPNDTDILITHGPMYGHSDMTDQGVSAGCEELGSAIARVQPRLHVFGHIHEARGMQDFVFDLPKPKVCTVVNASSLTSQYRPYRDPVTYINLPEKNITFNLTH